MNRIGLMVIGIVAVGGAAAYYFVAEPRLRLSRPAYRVELTETEVKLDGKFVHPIVNGEVPEKARAQGASYPLFAKASELIDSKKLRSEERAVVELRVSPKNNFRTIRRLLLALQQVEVTQIHLLESDADCDGGFAASLIYLTMHAATGKKLKGSILQLRLGEKKFEAGVDPWPNIPDIGDFPRGPVPKWEKFEYTQAGLNQFIARANEWARSKNVLQLGVSAEPFDLPWARARSVLCALRKRSALTSQLAFPGLLDRLRLGPPQLRWIGRHAAVGDHGVILWDANL